MERDTEYDAVSDREHTLDTLHLRKNCEVHKMCQSCCASQGCTGVSVLDCRVGELRGKP